MPNARYQRTTIQLPTRELALYVSPRISTALEEATMDFTLYRAVRLGQVLEAVYEQGMKDGRREIIEKMDEIREEANYMPPGRPRIR